MDNLRIWNAVSKTDPKHTKGFKRSGGFQGTAIKPIWLTKRLTEQFGPAGIGWGMGQPEFQTVSAPPDEILVFCTVALWYREGETLGTVYGVGGDKVLSKNKYGPYTNDEAFKASYTDALSNAMKQIGMGADIHMGLFEDEKYVRETTREFANGNAEPSPPPAMGSLTPTGHKPAPAYRVGNSPEPRGLQHVDPADQHLIQGDGRSTYQLKTADKSPGRLAAELWASNAVLLFKQPGYSLLDYSEWKAQPCANKGTKSNEAKLMELREKHEDLAQAIDDAVSSINSVAA
jgi:hypothetical protein